MAKALLGHVRGPDHHVAAEVRRLRQRVGDLEAQLARLKEERRAAPPAPESQALPLGSPPAPPVSPPAPSGSQALPSGSPAVPPGSRTVPLGPATPPEPRKPSA
jgi:hypothetical protein